LKTEGHDYTKRLKSLESGWKRWLDVQRPYRLHLQRLGLGFVLDVGCGLGRNLLHLGGNGVGIDHNPHSVAVARQRGLAAFTPEEFATSSYGTGEQFDTILLSHVAEHLEKPQLLALLRTYLPSLRPGGRVLFITPQERGFASDPTHVTFMDFGLLAAVAIEAGLAVERQYSFPFPRFMGRLFTYNEFVVVCRKKP
jgi:2-polyprenyl-3-methyl-5-hydroxy-6-metoxy-1,4-benzoquinol methylase